MPEKFIKAYEDAVILMKSKPDAMYFEGSCSDELIEYAEQRLNVTFPPTYKRFLKEYGAGSFGGSEFYGVTKDQDGELLDPLHVVSKTLIAQKNYDLPKQLVLISELGNGAVYCLDCSKAGKSPVIVYWSTFPREVQEYETEAEDFGEFFLNQIKISLDVLQSD